MPATNSTPNYDLPIYLPDDHFSILGDLNSAMTTLDGTMAVVEQSTTTAAANAAAALTAAQAAQTAAEGAATSASAASVNAATASAKADTAAETAATARQDASAATSTAGAAATDAANALTTAQRAEGTANAARQDTEDGRTALTQGAYLKSDTGSGTYTFTGDNDEHTAVTLTANNLTVGQVYLAIATFDIRNQSEYEPQVDLSVTLDGTRIGPVLPVASDAFYMGQTVTRAFRATSTSHSVAMKAKGRGAGSVNATLYDVDCFLQVVG